MRIVAMSALALLGLSQALLPAAAQAGLIITTRSGLFGSSHKRSVRAGSCG